MTSRVISAKELPLVSITSVAVAMSWGTQSVIGDNEPFMILCGTDLQVFFNMSFCRPVIISTKRRQTFSIKLMTLLRSASLGNCKRGSSELAAGACGLTVPGSGRLCARISFLTAAFSACRRSEEHTSELQSHSDLVCRLL